MEVNRQVRILAGITAAVMLMFTGNSLFSRPEAAQIPEETAPSTQPLRTEETIHDMMETTGETETTQPGPDPVLTGAMADMDGTHIFVYDLTQGRMLASKSGETDTLYPASITKLYAVWLALEHLSPDTVVTAGEELSLVQPGSSLAYISKGCQVTVEMLAQAMLLPSGNDAAYVLAAAAGRSIAGDASLGGREAVQVFVAEMNRKAPELGLVHSQFENPDGYHMESHYSCPHDVAIIGKLAAENEIIAHYAAMAADTVKYISGENITWYNTNRMVNPNAPEYCSDALGLKTGYTGQAGYCLLASFGRGEQRILVGIFGAEENLPRYENAAKLWQLCGG